MGKVVILFLITLVLLVCGCTGGGQRPVSMNPGTDGVVITSFDSDYPEIESEEYLELLLEAQNMGDAQATNIVAEIFNYDGFIVSDERKSLHDDSLAPPLESIPGEIGDVSWTLQAPFVETNMINPIDLGVRLFYEYETRCMSDIIVINEDEWKARTREGGEILVGGSASTAGPVSLTIETTRQPVILRGSETKFLVRIGVENVGDGRVYDSTEIDNNYGYLQSTELVLPVGLRAVPGECDYEGASSYETRDVLTITDPSRLKLRKSLEKAYSCRLEVPESKVHVLQTFKIIAGAKYAYAIDDIIHVEVTGGE